jgi:hypothetical protein
MEDKKYYVYKHYIDDPDKPFYIGMGSNGKYKYRYKDKGRSRSISWNEYVANNGGKFQHDIIESGFTRREAFRLEIELIKKYGRADKGKGMLVNLTDGGDGCNGVPCKPETKEKLRIKSTGVVFTQERLDNLSKANTLEKNPSWKGGITKNMEEYYKMPDVIERRRNNFLEYYEKNINYIKAWQKAYSSTREFKDKRNAKLKEQRRLKKLEQQKGDK